MANEDTITIDTSALSDSDVYLDIDSMSAYSYNISNVGAVGTSASIYTTSGMNGTSGQYLTSGGTGNNIWTTNTSPWTISSTSSNPSSLNVTGDAEFEGDVKIKGVSIAKVLDDIQKRLAILVPDPAKLAHFEALKKAYEHYKTLEALCEVPKEESKD